ncbi:TlpA family protein disulfide reductase [Crassaminicella profunda]|uniref:TlpA family protein disulfide reductase n=1 Tax=Crassaminicella profunda TaxID=1286698 RepID=UPI001CA68CE1|nr:TlpA disulfide reductase family protein [Crassaminicella profunda]QZY53857.1 TlpA family protein disulfide reductase [Crassaminicella profunda]
MKKKTKIGLIIGTVLLGLMGFIFIDVHPDGSISLDGDGFYKRHFMNKEKFVNLEEKAEKLATNPLEDKMVPAFKAKDMDGNEITEKLFKEHKLTMINLWGTFCGPCINEMPDLEKLSEEISKKDVNLVGIIADVKKDKNKKEAENIIKKTGVTYVNIIPDQVLLDEIVSKFDYVPASIFIDQKGNILKTHVAGANSYEEYLEIVNEILERNNKQ